MRVRARLTRQNQLTLPKVIRERLNIAGGDVVIFTVTDDAILIDGREMRLDEIRGSLVLPESASEDFGLEIEAATAKAMERYRDESRLGVPGSPTWADSDHREEVDDLLARVSSSEDERQDGTASSNNDEVESRVPRRANVPGRSTVVVGG